MNEYIKSVSLDDKNSEVVILDQTLLPNEKIFLRLTNQNQIWEAIYELRVRGAPAIGIAGAYGIYIAIKHLEVESYIEFKKEFDKSKEYLASSRPTAVNLCWALDRMEQKLIENKEKSIDELKVILKEEAEAIRLDDENICRTIGEYGVSLLKDNIGILTHCNAGAIATARYGTALAPIYIGKEKGLNLKVFADETRPLLQGARLTAWELFEAGIDVTLICDNMAGTVMKEGKIDIVFVGCDRVARNGDTANKIGTLGVAIMAKRYNIPFYVCCPISTIDVNSKTGDDINIEFRNGKEIISKWYKKDMAPSGVKTYNPAFDVTDNDLISGIITEKGILYPPFEEKIKNLF